MTVKRWALAAGTAGLVGGAALGVTGFASADSTPTPSPGAHGRQGAQPPLGRGFDRGFGKHLGRGKELGRGFGRGGGLVAALSTNSVTVHTPSGTETIGLTASTSYYSGQTKATRAILSVGDIVAFRLADPKAASPVATVVTVVPAHVAGFVTKIDGSTITIVDASGFTRTIRTSSSTTYEKDGAPAKAAAVTVGALVRAVGAVDPDGTTLDASRVSVGARPARAGGHHPGAPGGAPAGPTA